MSHLYLVKSDGIVFNLIAIKLNAVSFTFCLSAFNENFLPDCLLL